MATKTKAAKKTGAATLPASITLPALKAGEKWKGVVLGADGAPAYHLILLPGLAKDLTHEKALKWAKDQGGQLPDRADGALLYANNADEAIEKTWHWLEPLPAGDPGYAWCQGFGNGVQGWGRRSGHCRACAVRRVAIQ